MRASGGKHTYGLPAEPRRRSFEEWLQVPVGEQALDGRFVVRKARETDYEAIYDLVDSAFGWKRPRDRYEWMYRANPRGRARCWIAVDQTTGSVVACRVMWPWPMAHGDRALSGFLVGDWVVSPRSRKQGLSALVVRVSAPEIEQAGTTLFGWISAEGRAASQRFTQMLAVGVLPRRTLILSARDILKGRGWNGRTAALIAPLANVALTRRWKRAEKRSERLVVERVDRFDSDFDPLTARCMRWDGFWSPHDSGFLNWRYLAHPSEHVAFAAFVEGRPVGYGVVRPDPQACVLMELVAPDSEPVVARALLLHALRLAREAGSSHLVFFAPPGWRHWRQLDDFGFFRSPSQIMLYATGPREPAANRLESWQLVPGDHDAT